MAPGRQLFRHVRRDPGLLASPDSFRGSRRQQRLGGGLGPLAAHPRVRALQGGRVQPDAITARPFGPAGCEGSRRPDRSHRHRYDPRPRSTEGLPRVRRTGHPRRSGEGRRRHLPRPSVGVDGCELARQCGEGDGAPAGVICSSSLRSQPQMSGPGGETMSKTMTNHRIGTRQEWLTARETLLAREKEHTRLGDEIALRRRKLPWVRVGKEYRFDTNNGTRTLAQLFDGRSQLVVSRNARETGTGVVRYLTESPGFSVFALDDGAVYHTYSAGARGVEFLMSYYAILDRVPKGRDEGHRWQMWLRRHDEYGSK